MKPTIRIKFIDFSPNTIPENTYYYKVLAKHFTIEMSDKPDYIIAGGQRFDHYQYGLDVVKILFLAENMAADFNDFDYVAGFDHIEFGDRYLRLPFFATYQAYKSLATRPSIQPEQALNRKFCSFVVSNSSFASPMRQKFFKRLSQYKRVDSGGRWLNNVGGPIKNKMEFCKGYKFNIAFENSAYPGYTTEKIVEAYAADSIPIYFGNPIVETDFRPESMIRVHDETDIERAVEEVVRLDNDDDAYLAKLREPCLIHEDIDFYEKKLERFLLHIFNQPHSSAKRRCAYGFQQMMRNHLKLVMGIDQRLCDLRRKMHL